MRKRSVNVATATTTRCGGPVPVATFSVHKTLVTAVSLTLHKTLAERS
ncbi:hypothetical protein [Lysinibacillus sp. TE18511]